MKSDLVDIEMVIHVETPKAILASDDGDKDKAVWLPLSQAEVERKPGGKAAVVTLPEWLAVEKGLV